MLPSDDSLLLMRLLSHRRTSLAVLRELGFAQENLPVEATTVKDAFLALDFFGGDAVVKLPWSCSGRGVFYAAAMKRPQLESVIRGGIARQGSVMVERRFERIRDFAMLFCSEPKGVSFRGFSVFATDASGNYSGNLIASQEILLERLGIDPLPLIPSNIIFFSMLSLESNFPTENLSYFSYSFTTASNFGSDIFNGNTFFI